MKHSTNKRVNVGGLWFDAITQDDLIHDIERHLESSAKQSFCIAKPYVEFFTQAWQDPKLTKILTEMDRVVADGVGVQWAASYLAGKTGFWRWVYSLVVDVQNKQWREQIIPERGAGVDATKRLLRVASNKGWTVGILGGPKDAGQTQESLRRLYPKLKLLKVWSGYYDLVDEPHLVDEIHTQHPDILFVAQGFPRQEMFINRNKSKSIARIMIGEGGTFDFDSMGGSLKRAPKWLRQIGFEWLWRLILEPQRWRRQLALPRFVWGIYKLGQQK